MKYFFYDTCSLLNYGKLVFDADEKFFISSITLKELEGIKTSAIKDQDVKYKTRQLIRLLAKYEDKYKVIMYQNSWDNDLKQYPVLSDNNDSRIILSALKTHELQNIDLMFVTQDLCCKKIAEAVGLDVDYDTEEDGHYSGYIEVQYQNDAELADLYDNKIYNTKENPFGLLINQYLLVKDPKGNIIDQYKYTKNGCERTADFIAFESKLFGKVKPKDKYQLIAMDSLKENKITALRGPAGTGKSYLAMSYLFNELDKGHIDKIIIFCNTVATNGSAKLGYYPGSKDEKLLDSQIGNFLASKIGDKIAVEEMVDKGVLTLLPMADVRGYDTSGMKAGVYITEAQNMDVELMRLALQRIGEDSICIIDGDSDAQVDLGIYAGRNNGLRRMSKTFRGEDVYGEVTLPNIYRSRIAQIAQRM